jgi:hypothetical protein
MPPPNLLPGEGTSLKIKIAAVMTQIGLVTEVDGPSMDIAAVPTTYLLSPLHTNRPSRLPKPDKCSFKLWFDPNDATVQSIFVTRMSTPGVIDDFQIDFNDGNTTRSMCTFSAFVSKFKVAGIKVEENIQADIELMLTTIPIFTAGTP